MLDRGDLKAHEAASAYCSTAVVLGAPANPDRLATPELPTAVPLKRFSGNQRKIGRSALNRILSKHGYSDCMQHRMGALNQDYADR